MKLKGKKMQLNMNMTVLFERYLETGNTVHARHFVEALAVSLGAERAPCFMSDCEKVTEISINQKLRDFAQSEHDTQFGKVDWNSVVSSYTVVKMLMDSVERYQGKLGEFNS